MSKGKVKPFSLNLQIDVPLARFTTIKIGGPARYLISVTHESQLNDAIEWAEGNRINWIVIGRGSNLLIHDEGFLGLIIINAIEYESWTIEEDRAKVTVGAGTNLASLAARASKKGWGGLEFACGIPASVGGAVCMNAGAHGFEIQSVIDQVKIYESGSYHFLKSAECQFTYRSSRFHQRHQVILEATFNLIKDPKALMRVKEWREYRLKTQPWKEATSGCFFRNPETLIEGIKWSAGALIEQADLKGCQIGGAQVSTKHASFLVNAQKATAKDILELCARIRYEVFKKYKVELQGEVRFLDQHASSTRTI
jgi:UDP-N-acetylmuramate dehydrogenase